MKRDDLSHRTLRLVWEQLSRPMQQALIFLSIPPAERRTTWKPRPTPRATTLRALEERALARRASASPVNGKPTFVWLLSAAGATLLKEGADTTRAAPAAASAARADAGNARGGAAPDVRHVTVTISAEAFGALAMLGRSYACTGEGETIDDAQAVDRALVHMACSAADGVRRPGAWERGWVLQAFGEIATEPHVDGVPFHEQPTHKGGRR